MARNKTSKPKEKMVTRTFPVKYNYKVYDFTGEPKLLGELSVTEIPTKEEEKQLAEKYGIETILLKLISVEEQTLEMPVSKFKEIATPVKEDNN